MLGFFQKKNRDKNRETWIIAGLGNPGPEYSDSRHNCGFRAIDKLKEKSLQMRKNCRNSKENIFPACIMTQKLYC